MKTEYVVTVNRPLSSEEAIRIIDAIIGVDDSEFIPVPCSGRRCSNGPIEYDDIRLGARVTLVVA